MKDFSCFKKMILIYKGVSIIMLLWILLGCGEVPVDKDIERSIGGLEEFIGDLAVKNIDDVLENGDFSLEVKQRGNLAISQWENDVVNPVPILIYARIAKPKDYNDIALGMYMSDEDRDIVGIGIKEHHIKSHGKLKIIEELYPIYIHKAPLKVDTGGGIVSIRTEDQRKNKKLCMTMLAIKPQKLCPKYGFPYQSPIKWTFGCGSMIKLATSQSL